MFEPPDTTEDTGLSQSWIPKLCQIEIPMGDIPRTLTFYREVFGWVPAPIEIHSYFVMQIPEELPYGVSLVPQTFSSKKGPQITLYYEVDSESQREAIVKKAETWEGKSLGPARALPGYGSVQFILDPNGNRFGLFFGQK